MTEATIDVGRLDLLEGGRLDGVRQHVTCYGTLNADRSNAILVPHALTGSSRVAEWWEGAIGEGRLLDPRRWYVVGINALGSCYGSTGPASAAPDGRAYGSRFPHVTVRDIVRAQARALERLGVERLAFVIGGSLGGMQALQWALDFPERVRNAIAIGSHDHHTALGIALNAIQRDCIRNDPQRGIRTARKLAVLSYKSAALLRERHERRADRLNRHRFDVEGYLEYQADLFERRMDPASYAALTHAMDSFDLRSSHPELTPCHPEPVEGHELVEEPSKPTKPTLLFVGISSDWLFHPSDVRAAAARFAALGFDARYLEVQSDHGHDAFLAEPQAIAALLAPEIARL